MPKTFDHQENRIEISGVLREKGPARKTPAGVSVIEFVVEHESIQEEASVKRHVVCSVDCIVIGDLAGLLDLANPGAQLVLTGFVAPKSLKSRTLILHVKNIEFLEGTENGL